MAGQIALLVGSADRGGCSLSRQDWEPHEPLRAAARRWPCVSEPFRLRHEELHFVGHAFLALVLAMTLLGPTPAAVLGVVDAWSSTRCGRRAQWRPTLANVSTYAFFPLVGGVLFEALGGRRLLDDAAALRASCVLLVFLATNVAQLPADRASTSRSSTASRSVRSLADVYLPAAARRVRHRPADRRRRVRLPGRRPRAPSACWPSSGSIFQYLLQHRAELAWSARSELEGRTRELASLQVGLLSTVLQTLVAARQDDRAPLGRGRPLLARDRRASSGLDEHDQDVVHTAALLHDIGKFIFPDSILFADSKLTAEEYEIVSAIPEQGARLVARIDGYGPVAEIILAHHERIDGNGLSRTGWSARRSRSPRGSSRSRTRTT